MSLASQSQQWYPTSLQVTVFQARNLRIKGKNGTNDAYAIIQMAKDKFSTSVVEKCVSPVWKEEATFDLPLFHRGNADRCTLYIIVMHRALVGLDKLLGQAVINLLELHENKSRNKTEWFKLVDKNGKADKDRGEVLLDIQFMRNNITASMFDLSMQEKPRSHIGKLKDKIRGKKSGFSDSASAIVPSVTQVMTDSEEDADAHAEPSGAKKKSKIKSLFGPKSNLQRNVSQSMSTLGTLPEKNSALSGSRSSGLNVDSPEAKKKFKFLTHKRTDSSDSRTSLGPFSLLNRSKQNVVEQSGVCINGSHVYTEETEPKSSTLSLPSSSQGSTEDVRPVLGRNPSDVSVDSLKGLSLPSYRAESRQKTQLEDERQQAERVQEERARLEEQQRRREEQDKRKLEEERRKLEEQQKKQQEEEEERRKQEEARRAEERKRQEDLKKSVEASTREEPTVTNRLSSLFGIGRKKEEHSTASQEEKHGVEEPPPAGSTTPFEEIPLSPEPANPFDESSQQASQSLHNSTGFSNRTAKVYPVKPRFVAESIQGTPPSPSADPYIESHLPSSSTPNSTNPTVPSESTDMFSTLHSSLAPPNARRSSSDSLSSINENLDTESHRPSISQKRQAPLPAGQKASAKHEVSPSVHSGNSQSTEAGKPKAAPRSLSSKTAATSGYLNPIAEVSDSREKESSAFQRDKQPPLPLPDYDELFPKRRHGILGQVKWDMVISEVNLKQKKNKADIDQHEMSIDGPDLSSESIQVQDEKPDIFSRMTESQDQEEPFPVWKRRPITNKQPVVPPKPKVVTPPGEIPKMVGSVTEKPNPFASKVFLAATPKVQNTDAPQVKSRILLQCETKVQNTDVDVGKRKDNSPKDMQNSTVVGKDVVSPGDRKTSFKSYEDSLPVKPRQSSLNRAPISNVSNQETLGSMVTQKPQNEAKDTKVLEKVSGTGEINEVSMTTNNTDLFSGNISLKTPTVTKPDLEEKAVQSPAKQLVVESDPFLNNSFLSKDLLVGKNAESQGDANTPLKGTKESPPVKPRQSPLNSAPIGNFPVHEKLGSMVTQKPQNEAKDTEMLEEVSGSEEIIEGSMTMAQDADLFSDAFVKTNVSKPDSKEKAVANSPVKEQVVELDSFPNDLFLSKDPVLVKDAESQGDTKTHLKSTKESPPVKPRQSSRIIAPVRTTPVQEKLGSMVTQKPQNEAKDTKMLEEVSGSEEIIEGSMTMAQDADLFSDAFVKTNVSKPDSKEKAVANSPVKEQVVELDSFPNDLFLSKDPVLVKDAESQGDTKTHLKSTKESRPVKPRQSSRIIAPVRTTPVQEKLGSMVTQKPQNEAKDSKILEKVSGSEEINEESTALTKGTDLFSDGIFVKINVSKPDCEEKAEGSPAKWRIVEPDPFPNDVFLSKDPWALPLESKNKSEQIMSEEDLEKIFSSNIVDPFTGFVHNVSAKSPEPKIEMTVKTNPELSSGTQSNLFTKKKKAPPLPVNAANADKITTEHLFKRKPMVTMSTGEPKMETHIQNLDRPAKTDSAVFQSKKTVVAADPIPSASSPVSSSLTSPEPQMSATEEGTAHRGVTSGGKTLLRAWVTPSESQSVSVQSSSGGGAIGKMGEPASSLRRPHPVKPLGSESLISSSTLQGRDSKPTETHEPVLRKPKVTASESGPYSQLTQEELITLVVKQQAEISKKDAKILELEEYIDNLLVRVIDEKPSILMSMPTSKKAF